MGKEAEGNQVCLVRKKYDATKLSYLTEEVKEDYVELITEFAHTWRRLTIRQDVRWEDSLDTLHQRLHHTEEIAVWDEGNFDPGQYKRRFRILYGDVVRGRWCSRSDRGLWRVA